MVALVTVNAYWKMVYTAAPALTAGLAPTVLSHLNSLVATTKTMMKVIHLFINMNLQLLLHSIISFNITF